MKAKRRAEQKAPIGMAMAVKMKPPAPNGHPPFSGEYKKVINCTPTPKRLTAHWGQFSLADSAMYLHLRDQTLRNVLSTGKGPASSRTITRRVRVSIEALDAWIAEHASGTGGSDRFFPVNRVGIAEVVKFLKASNAPQFQGKSDKQLRDWLAAARFGRCDGPAWVKLGGKISYFVPEVLAWAQANGITSTYPMQPQIAEVIVIGTEPRSTS